MISLYLISLLLFLLYNILAIFVWFRKVPSSLSTTHYMFRAISKKHEWIFTAFCYLVTFTILPVWLHFSPSNIQFLAFFSAGALGFVGASPFFKDSKLESCVHNISAIICLTASFIWAFVAGNMWIALIALLLSIILILLRKNSVNFIYWIEVIAFVQIFLQLTLLIF